MSASEALAVATRGVFDEFDIEPADLAYLRSVEETLTPDIREWIAAQWQAEVEALSWFEALRLKPLQTAALARAMDAYLARLLAGDRIEDLYGEMECAALVAIRHGVRNTDLFQASTKLEAVLTGVTLQLFPSSDQQTIALVTLAKFLKSLLYVVMETYRREAANELEGRNQELASALEQQTATAEVLHVISSSPGDLAPVFDAMLEKARRLCEANFAVMNTYDGERFLPLVAHGVPVAFEQLLLSHPPQPGPRNALSRLARGEDLVRIDDLRKAPAYRSGDPRARAIVELGGARSYVIVALRKDGRLLGTLAAYRQDVRPFSDKEVVLLQNFAAQAVIAMENARLITETREARDAAESSLRDLKAAQANLIQAEKMASLGQLTAGIAHEIKNPLNFVNNFASLSVELLDELKEATEPAVAALGEDKRAEVDETIEMLSGNLEKIAEHGKRADNIVKSMLEHSRGVTGERREVDLNNLIDEALNLAYHGARAQDQGFNITLERDFAPALKPIELAPQEMTRVFLNLFGNGFYAANNRARENGDGSFRPRLTVATREDGNAVEVRVRDNGTGIPPELRNKLFQPFFTTKPTGEGTGLGLSITYDIVTQQHGGTIEVDSMVGEFTEFTVRLPRQ